MEALDGVFKMFFYTICDIAKWLFAIQMATNLIKNFKSADLRTMVSDLLMGGFAYGALYSIVSILDSVKSQFR